METMKRIYRTIFFGILAIVQSSDCLLADQASEKTGMNEAMIEARPPVIQSNGGSDIRKIMVNLICKMTNDSDSDVFISSPVLDTDVTISKFDVSYKEKLVRFVLGAKGSMTHYVDRNYQLLYKNKFRSDKANHPGGSFGSSGELKFVFPLDACRRIIDAKYADGSGNLAFDEVYNEDLSVYDRVIIGGLVRVVVYNAKNESISTIAKPFEICFRIDRIGVVNFVK